MKTVNDASKDKDKALEQVLNDIEKQIGKGSIMKLGDDKFEDVDVIQVGARNMQNFDLLKVLGHQEKPCLLLKTHNYIHPSMSFLFF